jgi:hypothetical protein
MVFVAVLISMFMVLSSLGPRYAPESTGKVYSGIGKIIGEKAV